MFKICSTLFQEFKKTLDMTPTLQDISRTSKKQGKQSRFSATHKTLTPFVKKTLVWPTDFQDNYDQILFDSTLTYIHEFKNTKARSNTKQEANSKETRYE